MEVEDIEEYFADEMAYPDLDDPDLAVMRDYGDKESDIITMWERVKNYGNINKILGIVFGVLGGAIVIAVVVIIILKRPVEKAKSQKLQQNLKQIVKMKKMTTMNQML